LSEGVGQIVQPLADQALDLDGAKSVGDLLKPGGINAAQEAVVQGFVGDALLGQLALGVLVAVEVQLGVVREVGAELQEEWSEVPVHAVEVVMVDHGRGADDPGVGLARFGMATLLRPEDGSLLLGLAHEDDPLLALEVGQVLGRDVVLALALLEEDDRDLMLLGEAVDGRDKALGNGIHQRRGGEGMATVETKEEHDTPVRLEPGDVDVEVHSVDTLDFQGDVILQDFGHSPCYNHRCLWLQAALTGQLTAERSNMGQVSLSYLGLQPEVSCCPKGHRVHPYNSSV